MSKNTSSTDFESAWQTKLTASLERFLEPADLTRVLQGGEVLQDSTPALEKTIWTCGLLDKLDEDLDLDLQQEILTSCACHYPSEDLLEAKMTYHLFGNIDQVLEMLQKKFEAFLRNDLALDESLIEEIISNGWGLAGRREGKKILATKIPKSGYLVEYFQTEDPIEKRKLYCHCPRVRDTVGNQPRLPKTYCYCGAGFYQNIWETILDQPIKVEVLKSVMHGDDVCQIAVHLPDSAFPQQSP
jgi:predicted hydrocarbon binding protein